LIIKCFNEEVKASNKNLTNLLSVFFTTFSFCVIFIVEVSSLYGFNQSLYCFLWEKVGDFENSRLLGGCEKNQLLLLTLTFITNTK